jgi:hypothetical protein
MREIPEPERQEWIALLRERAYPLSIAWPPGPGPASGARPFSAGLRLVQLRMSATIEMISRMVERRIRTRDSATSRSASGTVRSINW